MAYRAHRVGHVADLAAQSASPDIRPSYRLTRQGRCDGAERFKHGVQNPKNFGSSIVPLVR